MERKYSLKHLWIEINGQTARIGITDFLQENLGGIMFINLPEPGDTVKISQVFGDIESKKTVMDMESIVSGKVLNINEDVVDEPYLINESPNESWLFEIEFDEIADDLIDESTYLKHISTLGVLFNKE